MALAFRGMKGKRPVEDLLVACLVPLVVACSQAPPSSSSQVSSQPSSPPSSQPSPQSTAQVTWPIDLSLSQVDFSCRLPVLDVVQPGIADAFINFPAGSLTPAGSGGYYYDWVVGRWLPVGRYSVSPDGRSYAVAKDWSVHGSPARVHIVDAATEADVWVVTMPDQREYGVVDFTISGVTVVPFGNTVEAGVWRVDPATGALTKISDGYYQPPVGEWIGMVDPRDPNHQFSHATGSPVAQPDRIDRRDDSGKTTTWIYKPGYWLYWFAFVGSPLLLVEASRVAATGGVDEHQYWLVTGPGRLTMLSGYAGQEPSPYRDLAFASGLADKHGIWMSGSTSIYLINKSGAIFRVSDHGGVPVNSCS